MSKPEDGGPAFPFTPNEQRQLQDGTWDQNGESGDEGMSLRDWFAGQALTAAQALTLADGNRQLNTSELAMLLYQIADAMIAEREKP